MTQRKALTALRILYPIWTVVSLISLVYIPSHFVVEGDATATASNISSDELLFRLGIVASLVTQLLFIFAALFLYKVFEPVDRGQSQLVVMLALLSVPIAMVNTFNKAAALLTLADPDRMMFFLDLEVQGNIITSVFWGLWLFPLGVLAYRSGYVPRLMGVSVLVAGVGYVLSFLVQILAVGSDALLSVLDTMTIGEVVFIIWIVVMGAKVPEAGAREEEVSGKAHPALSPEPAVNP